MQVKITVEVENISDNVEINESEPENSISDHSTESDHNILQFLDCNFKVLKVAVMKMEWILMIMWLMTIM